MSRQGSKDGDPFGEDCLYLDDPQEEAFIAQLDTRIANCDVNFSQPTTSNVNDVTEFTTQDQVDNQSVEFLASGKIMSEFQIEERNDLLCENSENLQFDIDPPFAENVTDPVQSELSNFNNGTLFDQTIEANFEETTDNEVVTSVDFENETVIDNDLQESNFRFEKSNSNQEEIQLQDDYADDNDFVGNRQQSDVQLFTAFKSTEPPKEILQEESQSSNFEQQDVNTRLSVDIEPSTDILQNQSELQDLQSAFDQSQGQVQIFDSIEALPELSQQESNLFFEQLDQMEGNFPQPDQDSTCKEDNKVPDDNDELSNQSKEKTFVNNIPEVQSGDETQNSLFDSSREQNESSETQVPLEPPPIFELQELMHQYDSPDSSDSFKTHKKPLEPPPMFDPMEAFPDLLDESNEPFETQQNQEKPLEPPPMFEFIQECDTKPIVNIKKSKKLDHREEHSNSSFDMKQNNDILQPPPAFDPRGPPPTVTIIEEKGFKSHNFEDVIQPPKVFDPRLSSQQRMDFVATNEIVPPTWPSGITDYTNYVPSMHVPPMAQPAGFIPPFTIPSVIPTMPPTLPDYPPPLPQDHQAPPPLPVEPPDIPESLSMLNMEDELEEMQEAMEFAKQLMNMTESNGEKNTDHDIEIKREKKSKKSKNDKKDSTSKESKKEDKRKKIEYGPAPLIDLPPNDTNEEESRLQEPEIEDDGQVADDQMRPKVVFNLNKIKRIHKVDEWQQQLQADENEDLRTRKKKLKEKEILQETNETNDKDDEKRKRRRSKDNNNKKEEKPSTSYEKEQQKKSGKKETAANQEIWRNRVINQFLKMSKNDINNMINNTSLRRFDMAMKQLVKERKTSLSQEMRISEEEKVQNYDGDQFMTQLSAMLDPGVRESVDITNLPTEFIQHLSAVLHLDPMPGGEDGEIEMMNSEDFLQQMVLANKKHQQEQQIISEDEYTHLPKQTSPQTSITIQPVVEKKRNRHHEKKIVHVIRVKDTNNQSESHEQGKQIFFSPLLYYSKDSKNYFIFFSITIIKRGKIVTRTRKWRCYISKFIEGKSSIKRGTNS